MKFIRESYFGLDFSWFATDKMGQIAKLTTGYGPIPEQVFRDEAAYNEVVDFFSRLEISSEAKLGRIARARKSRGTGDYSMYIEDAHKGFFAYDYHGHHGPYELMALPLTPLPKASLPRTVAENLIQLACSFSESDHIRVSAG